jgi:HD domain
LFKKLKVYGKFMREQLINKMKNTFGDDTKRINHALAVLHFAEEIQVAEGGNLVIVQVAAILHDIGIQEAFKKYGSTAGVHQEIEGPPIADIIMKSLEIDDETRRHVCLIVGSHHSGNKIDTQEFRCIWDADWIVNLSGMYETWSPEKKQHTIKKYFRTETGKRLARAGLGLEQEG